MKSLKIIGIGAAALIAILLIAAAIMPKDYTISASRVMKAPASVIYEQVNNLGNWDKWDPWVAIDPSIISTLEGPKSGVGNIRSWTSEKSGSGKMVITESVANESIKTDLELMEYGTNMKNEWSFEKTDEGTKVTWTSIGTSSWPSNLGNMFITGSIEEFYGIGLQSLEKLAKENWSNAVDRIERKPQRMLSVFKQTTMQTVSSDLGELYGKIGIYMAREGAQFAGMPFAIYHNYTGTEVGLEAGLPVNEELEGTDEVKAGFMPSGKMVSKVHLGPYDKLGEMHELIQAWMKDHGVEANGPPLEIYLTDPDEVQDPNMWETEVLYPVK